MRPVGPSRRALWWGRVHALGYSFAHRLTMQRANFRANGMHLMTRPRVRSDWLMFFRSLSLAKSTLSVPAVFAHSLPAKSTRCSFPVHSMTAPSAATIFFECTLRVKRQWERDDCLFILVSPTCRRSCARCISPSTSSGVCTVVWDGKTHR